MEQEETERTEKEKKKKKKGRAFGKRTARSFLLPLFPPVPSSFPPVPSSSHYLLPTIPIKPRPLLERKLFFLPDDFGRYTDGQEHADFLSLGHAQ